MPTFEVAESIVMDASPEQVRGILRDFRQWMPWSPWLSAEPTCKIEYASDGSSYSWDGKVVGSGAITLVEERDEALEYRLEFFKPWKSVNRAGFSVVAEGQGSRVTWTMQGSIPFFLFFMKKMMASWISSDFRRGLSKLKDYAETGSVPSSTEFVGVGEGVVTAYVGMRSKRPIAELSEIIPPQFERLRSWLDESGIEITGPALTIYHRFDVAKGITDYTAAMQVASIPASLPTDFVGGRLDAPRTYQVKHTGAYRHLGSAWSDGMMHQRAKLFKKSGSEAPFELYRNVDPTSAAEEAVTEVHFPAA